MNTVEFKFNGEAYICRVLEIDGKYYVIAPNELAKAALSPYMTDDEHARLLHEEEIAKLNMEIFDFADKSVLDLSDYELVRIIIWKNKGYFDNAKVSFKSKEEKDAAPCKTKAFKVVLQNILTRTVIIEACNEAQAENIAFKACRDGYLEVDYTYHDEERMKYECVQGFKLPDVCPHCGHKKNPDNYAEFIDLGGQCLNCGELIVVPD